VGKRLFREYEIQNLLESVVMLRLSVLFTVSGKLMVGGGASRSVTLGDDPIKDTVDTG